MRRVRILACAWAMGTAVFVAAALPSVAADTSPADALLDRARDAVATHEFTGLVRIGWRTESGLRWKNVPVRAVDGGLRLAGGDLVEDDGRAWLRTRSSWETLWSDTRAPRAPSVVAKYHVQVTDGPVVAGHPTRTLTISRRGHVVERYAFDRADGLVLRRVRFGDDGRVDASMAFVSLGPVRDVRGRLTTPKVGASAPQPMDHPPADAHRKVGVGFLLVGAHRVGAETQLQYSDGVFTASVFTRDGVIDRDALPNGGADVHYGDTVARRYRTAGGTVLTWESRGHTYTCVTDASDAEQQAMVASLNGGDDAWTNAVRFVTSPFSWF
jgi:hypothetical protein